VEWMQQWSLFLKLLCVLDAHLKLLAAVILSVMAF
jgi:hypothetical protein